MRRTHRPWARRSRHARVLAMPLAGLLALSACGQKGPLYIPDDVGEVVTRPMSGTAPGATPDSATQAPPAAPTSAPAPTPAPAPAPAPAPTQPAEPPAEPKPNGAPRSKN